MKIDLYRYHLPVTSPIALRNSTLTERVGFLVRMEEDGLEGWGEAAPLVGFSRETKEEVLEELRAMRDSGAGVDMTGLHGSSVRFAIESAQLDLQAQRAGATMAEVLNPEPLPRLALNALVVRSGERAISEAKLRVGEGYQTLKLKVGRSPLFDDIQTVNSIRKALPESINLRLDANRAWKFEEALAFADGLGDTVIEYIEEPLAEPNRLREFAAATGLSVALDESLVGMSPEKLADFEFARAIVLKPSISGGLTWALKMIEKARQMQIVPVVSGAFESGVGIRTLVAFAAAETTAPAGLSTYRLLADDVFSERMPLDQPLVDVAKLLAPRTPDVDKLERIL